MASANGGKGKAVAQFDEQACNEASSSKNVIVISSSSDDEDNGANDGASSLRIEEHARNGAVFIDLCPSSSPEPASVLGRSWDGGEIASGARNKRKIGEDNGSTKEKKKKKKKKIKDSSKSQEATVGEAGLVDENKVSGVTADESNSIEEPHAAQKTGNTIVQKLLKGPRYFDPPNSGGFSCYNCGEEGHMAVNCSSVKQKKPCFVCGSMQHNSRACTEVQDRFISLKVGHRANDCPEKYKSATRSAKICLKCGDSGHDMFTCRNDYSPNDLKEIRCYVCKSFGHLCCGKFGDTNLGEVSCYQCGRLGHSGLACSRLHGKSLGTGSLNSCYDCGEKGHLAQECRKPSTRSGEDASVVGSFTSCYKCGEEGHFERDCMKAGKRLVKKAIVAESSCYKCGEKGHFARGCRKVGKRNLQVSTSTQYNENGITPSYKSKRRGGWATEHVGEQSYWKVQGKGWTSPAVLDKRSIDRAWNYSATPNKRDLIIYPQSGRGWSTFSPSQTLATQNFVAQTPQVLGGQHGFSAVRFGSYSNTGMWKNYGW